MIQIEFNNDIDKIGLGVVEEELGMSFFKLDLSKIISLQTPFKRFNIINWNMIHTWSLKVLNFIQFN